LRGRLDSRRPDAILKEAEKLVAAGTRELLVISQDTSAYGRDLAHATFGTRGLRAHITDLARELGKLGAWVRLHYVYPYAHVDELVALMAEGLVLPYLDIPFQHASPRILKAMRRPADDAKVLERIAAWRALVPDLALRSTFIVGFPGETEEDFAHLLDWLEEAQLDRVGCFAYEAVAGADANALADAVPEEVKVERRERFMEKAAAISARRLQQKVGRTIEVIIDEADGPEGGGGAGGATGRSMADAPEIDGRVLLRDAAHLKPGDMIAARIEDADAFDLYGVPC
jgi:ribosomal protein S12 methylthiotransferase